MDIALVAHVKDQPVPLRMTALTSGLTIGGKALGKSFAIAKSTAVLQLVGRFLHLFSRKKR